MEIFPISPLNSSCSNQRVHQESKKCKVASLVLAPFRAIEHIFSSFFHRIYKMPKVVVYHSTLVFNVAMNALFPHRWKWWSEIDPHIILGAEPLANKGHLESMRGLGITLVLSKLEDFEYDDGLFTKPVKPEAWAKEHMTLWQSPTADGASINPNQLTNDIARIRQEIEAGGKVYVHCKAGRGRSAMTVIAYYMVYKHMTFDAAYAYVKERRSQVFLNPLQTKYLRGFRALG